MTPTETHRSRVAIVTGAARGIGAATARRLSNEGLAVAIVDLDAASCRTVADEIVRSGGIAIAVPMDVSDEGAVTRGLQLVVDLLGPPTVLVNNAGIIRDNLLHRMSLSDWESVLDVHLRGSFLMTRATQSHMVEASWGRIVNLSSTSALGNRGQSNYATAKAGIQGFTKTLALELGRFGITANAIAPGFIETEMTREAAHRQGLNFDDFRKDRAATIPVGRVGTTDDIANTVAFFTSESSGFISGQVLYVAGGPRC